MSAEQFDVAMIDTRDAVGRKKLRVPVGRLDGLKISTSALAYLAIFPALTRWRCTSAQVARPFRIAGGTWVLWAVSALTTAWALVGTVGLLWPRIGSSLPVSGGDSNSRRR